ncbi:hypothetical protein Clacol_002885 [Clathrus columnatus]|uniref:Uncharacterized protein n=1 Tax=Clathrus columnatus TaxID=1419009 RepID=A0AAV5A6N6_9AGAM|nr:hypothetical protein Clacol_002885 [Clathrus columnatus]
MNASDIPNPLTPLALLPESLADQFQVSRYILVATSGDLYLRLYPYEYDFSKFVNIISQLSPAQKVGSCSQLMLAVGWTFVVALSSTEFLFLLRIRAIFDDKKWVVALFFAMWLATVGGSVVVPFGIKGDHIGPTAYCINTVVQPYSSAGIVISAVNDTLVFFFISTRLMLWTSSNEGAGDRFRSFVQGNGLPAFSKMLLQSGQQVTVGGNIVTMAMILAPASLPAPYHAMFTVPNIAITNSMACRVFRDVKFGRIMMTTSTPVASGSRMPSFANTVVGVNRSNQFNSSTSTTMELGSVYQGHKVSLPLSSSEHHELETSVGAYGVWPPWLSW